MALMEQIGRRLAMSQHRGTSHHGPQLLTHYQSITLRCIKWLPQPVTLRELADPSARMPQAYASTLQVHSSATSP